MRVIALAGVATIGVWATVGAQQQTVPQRPPAVFRANTDLVTVPVFVKGNEGIVARLTADDFVLTDNGVPQQIQSFSADALPVDVTVLVETSRAMRDYAKSVNAHVRELMSQIRPTDRIEILGIDDYVNVLLPFGAPKRPFDVSQIPTGGLASVNDALVAALLREADPDRQHLIIAITDTIDTMSALDMATVRDVARHSSATLELVWVTMSGTAPPSWTTSAERVDAHGRGPAQRRSPQRAQWTPHYEPGPNRTFADFDVIREAAEVTGGQLRVGSLIDRNAAIIFRKVYAEFRSSVVLRYVPTGVARDGWHALSVTVPKHRDLEIRARQGYFVE